MILSYDITGKDNNPDSSVDSVKEEEYNQIETIMMKQNKQFPLIKPAFLQNTDSSNDLSLQDSSQLSKTDKSSSNKDSLSRGEDCLQKDIIQMLSQDSMKKKSTVLGDLQENSSDASNSSQNSHKSKNYILKSSIRGDSNTNSSNISLNKFNSNCMNYFLNGNSHTDDEDERNSNLSEHSNKMGLLIQLQQDSNVKDNSIQQIEDNNIISPIHRKGKIDLEKNDFFTQNPLFIKDNINENHNTTPNITNNNNNEQQNNPNVHTNNNYQINKPKEESNYIINNNDLFPNTESTIHNTTNTSTMNTSSINNIGNYNNHFPQNTIPSHFQQNQTNQPNINVYNQNIKQNFPSFNMNNSNFNSNHNIIENCLYICREQSGCRLLQKIIDDQPKQASDIYYKIIQNSIPELSCDQFGNYFVQKIIEHITIEQIDDLLKHRICNSFCQIGLNQYGTRVLQKLFDKIIHHEHLVQFYAYLLQPCLYQFIIDPNATHIIIKFASHVQSPINDFLISFLGENMHKIAMQKHACCTLQKCIEYSNPKQKHFLLLAIANISSTLFTDQYGNYVVQFAMSVSDFEINRIIVLNYLNEVNTFSSQKYSSNVIEKSLDCCDDQTKQLIIEKICNQKMVSTLLFDMYGNYVLQKAMSIAREPFRSMFIQMVGPSLENVKVLSFGQKLYYKLLLMFPELAMYTRNDNKGGFNKKRTKKKMNTLPQQQRNMMNEFDYYGNNMAQGNYYGGNYVGNQFSNNVNNSTNIYGITNQLGNMNMNNYYDYK